MKLAKELNATIGFEIKLNKRYQISKSQMIKITKSLLWDLFKANRKQELDVFVTDVTGRCYLFCICKRKPAYWNNHYPIVITCSYNDWELYEKGFITTDENYSNLNDTCFTNELFLDYTNSQNRYIDYPYSEYEFNKN